MNAPENMRLFVAVFPPAEIVSQLAAAATTLARGLSQKAVAWTRPEQIHLTLHFLGNVQRARVEEIQRAVDGACRQSESHRVQTRGIGCFPSPARPRILWAGLEVVGAGLETLKRALDESLANLGFTPVEQSFHPHLTIGRVKFLTGSDRHYLAATLPQWRGTDFGPWTVERAALMQSTLSPVGAEYARLQSFDLRPLR